jgi:alpha-beta hydrolase superfamily lysophospholipase
MGPGSAEQRKGSAAPRPGQETPVSSTAVGQRPVTNQLKRAGAGTSDFDPVILIHGAWQGSWAWARFTPYLEAAGFITRAIDLPGNGVDGTDPAAITFEQWLEYLRTRRTARRRNARHSGHGRTCRRLAPVANDPKRPITLLSFLAVVLEYRIKI